MTENNEEEETKISCRRIQNNLCRYSTLKGVRHNSPIQKYGLCIVTSFQRVQYGRGWVGRNFTVET